MPELHVEHGIKASRNQVAFGTQLIACGVLVVLAQVLLWLGEGQWPPFNIGELLRWAGAGEPVSAGLGVAFAVDCLLAIPISAGIAAIGFVIAWIGASNLAAASNSIASKS
jgi:hypothetical protein